MAVALAMHAFIFSFQAKMCDMQPGIYENSHLAGILCFTGGTAKDRVAHLTGGKKTAQHGDKVKEKQRQTD